MLAAVCDDAAAVGEAVAAEGAAGVVTDGRADVTDAGADSDAALGTTAVAAPTGECEADGAEPDALDEADGAVLTQITSRVPEASEPDG